MKKIIMCSNSINNNKGLSLMEITIVLIIIGFLTTTIVGASSLIRNARSRAMINELHNYERAVYIFKAAKGRFPGDPRNVGTFGYLSNYHDNSSAPKPLAQYFSSDVPNKYLNILGFNSVEECNAKGCYNRMPFVELYMEGIINFHPESDVGGLPLSLAFNKKKKITIKYTHTGYSNDFKGTPTQTKYRNGLVNAGSMQQAINYYDTTNTWKEGMDPRILKQVDLKIDDGEYWKGRVRSFCRKGSTDNGAASYYVSIENSSYCSSFYYAL